MLRDMDQPFIFGIQTGAKKVQFEFFDTSCPDNWRTLDPDAIVICYDISQRLSLINMQRYVSAPSTVSSMQLILDSGKMKSRNRFNASIPSPLSSLG